MGWIPLLPGQDNRIARGLGLLQPEDESVGLPAAVPVGLEVEDRVGPQISALFQNHFDGGVGAGDVPEIMIAPRLTGATGDDRTGLEPEEVNTPDVGVNVGHRSGTAAAQSYPRQVGSGDDTGAASTEDQSGNNQDYFRDS